MATATQVQPAGPATRFGAARGFFSDRRIRGFRTAFAALNEHLTDAEADTMEDLWYGRRLVTTEDLPLVERLENVVERLKHA